MVDFSLNKVKNYRSKYLKWDTGKSVYDVLLKKWGCSHKVVNVWQQRKRLEDSQRASIRIRYRHQSIAL